MIMMIIMIVMIVMMIVIITITRWRSAVCSAEFRASGMSLDTRDP